MSRHGISLSLVPVAGKVCLLFGLRTAAETRQPVLCLYEDKCDYHSLRSLPRRSRGRPGMEAWMDGGVEGVLPRCLSPETNSSSSLSDVQLLSRADV